MARYVAWSHRDAVEHCQEGDLAALAPSAESASSRGWMAMFSVRILVI